MNEMITSKQAVAELSIGSSTFTLWCKRLGFPKAGNTYILTRKQLKELEAAIYREGKRLPDSAYTEAAP